MKYGAEICEEVLTFKVIDRTGEFNSIVKRSNSKNADTNQRSKKSKLSDFINISTKLSKDLFHTDEKLQSLALIFSQLEEGGDGVGVSNATNLHDVIKHDITALNKDIEKLEQYVKRQTWSNKHTKLHCQAILLTLQTRLVSTSSDFKNILQANKDLLTESKLSNERDSSLNRTSQHSRRQHHHHQPHQQFHQLHHQQQQQQHPQQQSYQYQQQHRQQHNSSNYLDVRTEQQNFLNNNNTYNNAYNNTNNDDYNNQYKRNNHFNNTAPLSTTNPSYKSYPTNTSPPNTYIPSTHPSNIPPPSYTSYSTTAENPPSYSSSDYNNNSQQQILRQRRAGDEVVRGQDEVGAIEQTIVELGGIFQQLATMVHEQADVVCRIDSHVEESVLNVEAGHGELLKYLRTVSKTRSFMIKVFFVLILFFLIFTFVLR